MIKEKIAKLDLKFILIGLILVLTFFYTRLNAITKVPPSLYWDEASIGYNAYSISTSLKDEWGKFLPIHFRAFGEFKLPVYIYTVSVFVKAFGLNEFSVRTPAVLFSFVTIILVSLIVYQFFKNKFLSLASAFFLITSPWLFIFSRTGYEATAGCTFFILSFYLSLFVQRKSYIFILLTSSLILSIYSYNSFRIISPPTFLIYLALFCIQNKKEIGKKIWVIVVSLLIFGASFLPIIKLVTKDAGSVRFLEVKATSTLSIVKNYLSHFLPSFLFFNGDSNTRSQIPGFGELWIIDPIFIILGLIYIVSKKEKYHWAILILFLLSFIPASLTKESPHALRSLAAVYFYAIIWTFGLKFFVEKFGKRSTLLIIFMLITTTLLFVSYYSFFVTKYSTVSSQDWQYGYKQIATSYKTDIDKANKVIISDEYAQPYIFMLYYLKMDPSEYLKTRELNTVDKWGFSTVRAFGKFEFRKVTDLDFQKNTLIFVAPDQESLKKEKSGIINFLDNSPAFFVYKL